MMERDLEPTGRFQAAELQSLVNATTTPARQQRITAEMPVAHLNDLLDLVPAEVIAPRRRLRPDIAAAIFSVSVTVGLLLWVAAS